MGGEGGGCGGPGTGLIYIYMIFSSRYSWDLLDLGDILLKIRLTLVKTVTSFGEWLVNGLQGLHCLSINCSALSAEE